MEYINWGSRSIRNFYSKETNRKIPNLFEVHHIYQKPYKKYKDNSLENLVALPIDIHKKYHNLKKRLSTRFNKIGGTKNLSLIDISKEKNWKLKQYSDELIYTLPNFVSVYKEGSKWVDFRDYLLGKIKDIHNFNSLYIDNFDY